MASFDKIRPKRIASGRAVGLGTWLGLNLRCLLVAALILAMTIMPLYAVISASPVAAAFANAQFPTLADGVSGPSVTAWQYVLRHLMGASASQQPINGVFDGRTKQNTITYAGSPFGLVDAGVWAANVPLVGAASSGNAVRAVEAVLRTRYNQNTGTAFPVAVNGAWTTADKDALKIFQADAGLTQTGIVDLETWRNLTWHYVPRADNGKGTTCTPTYAVDNHLTGGSQRYDEWVTDFVGSEIDQWSETLRFIDLWDNTINVGPIRFTDANQAHGQNGTDHVTHRTGMDVDIRAIRLDKQQCTRAFSYTDPQYDRDDTAFMVAALLWTTADSNRRPLLEKIYFNDPMLINTYKPLMSWAEDHENHLHISWCTPGSGPNWAGNHTCFN